MVNESIYSFLYWIFFEDYVLIIKLNLHLNSYLNKILTDIFSLKFASDGEGIKFFLKKCFF